MNSKIKFTGFAVCAIALFYVLAPLQLHGDIIYFKNARDGISVAKADVGADFIATSVAKSAIDSVTISFNKGSDGYADAISINSESRIRCKIIEMKEREIVVRFPRSSVRSLQMEFDDGQNYQQTNYDRAPVQTQRESLDRAPVKEESSGDLDMLMLEELDNPSPRGGSSAQRSSGGYDSREYGSGGGGGSSSRDALKNELLSEIKQGKRSSGNPQSSGRGGSGGGGSGGDLLDRTLGGGSANYEQPSRSSGNDIMSESGGFSQSVNSNAGNVKGRFLQTGRPLASCKVRLVKLRKDGIVYYKDTDGAGKLETTTDRYGTYIFNNAPPGMYKLYWKPPMESSWIRRVNMEPDVLVTRGQVAYIEDIETNQRILN